MKYVLTVLLAIMLLSATIMESPGHCHGRNCDEQTQQSALDKSQKSSGGIDANDFVKCAHCWHVHYADMTVYRAVVSGISITKTTAHFLHPQVMASHTISPPLQPPSFA